MSGQLEELALFNTHQAGTRQGAEFFAKSIFLIGGGALTLSLTLFLGKDAQPIPPHLAVCLKWAWWLLFSCIVGLIAMQGVIQIRDYRFGEKWRRKMQGKIHEVEDSPGILDKIMWFLGVLSGISFLGGLAGLAYVSTSMLK